LKARHSLATDLKNYKEMENRVTKKTDAEQLAAKAPKSGVHTAKAIQSRPSGIAASLFQLQQTRGNRFTQQLLRSSAIQAKLTVSQPGDQYEQEADRVADQVMRMPDPATPATVRSDGPPQISRLQRKCAQGGEEEIRRQAMNGTMEEEEESSLQAKEVSGQVSEVTPAVQTQIDGVRGGGQPLSESTRAFFEPRFGRDFSNVRVHTDARAVESARAVNALAYTVGHDVVFGAGQYQPDTSAGQRLLAHELTHVTQQSYVAEKPPAMIGQRGKAYGSQTLGPVLQRVSFGNNGALSSERKAVVSQAAAIAERLVQTREFKKKWDSFQQGDGSKMTPKVTLEQYQAAVKSRVIHNMDTSMKAEVSEMVKEEKDLPLERQTAGVTIVSSQDTYLRQFAIDQGIDAVVNLILHESLHGAGLSMGPVMMYEPFLHKFEAEAGFPMMMGGAEITGVSQKRQGDYDLEITITYRLHKIGNEDLPANLEIQIVSADSGELVYDEQADGSRTPAKQAIANKVGDGKWVWKARYPGWRSYAVRIYNPGDLTLLGSRHFDASPRCVLGVSTRHCEDEEKSSPPPKIPVPAPAPGVFPPQPPPPGKPPAR
jgi:hypothetical protein